MSFETLISVTNMFFIGEMNTIFDQWSRSQKYELKIYHLEFTKFLSKNDKKWRDFDIDKSIRIRYTKQMNDNIL